MYIDIHNHLLFGVDDGPTEKEESIKLLEEAVNSGAEAIILTPHMRHGMFQYPKTEIEEHFRELQEYVLIHGLDVELKLGCEYHVSSQMVEDINSGRVHSLADGRYILTEYSFSTPYQVIRDKTDELYRFGYRPVIAHPERYDCLTNNIGNIEDIVSRGAILQINAGSVIGKEGFRTKSFCKKLLKNRFANIIASDTHDFTNRRNYMAECKTYVEKHFGTEYAESLFVETPRKVINR